MTRPSIAGENSDILVDVLLFGEINQRVRAVQSAEPAALISAHFRFREQTVVIVDPDRAVSERPGNTQGAGPVVRPDAGGKAENRVVRFGDGLSFRLECFDDDQGTENFFLTKECAGIRVGDECR